MGAAVDLKKIYMEIRELGAECSTQECGVFMVGSGPSRAASEQDWDSEECP